MTEKDYKSELKNCFIKYRSSLNLPDDITFGIEIEYENIIKDTISWILNEEVLFNDNLKGWNNKTELDIGEYNKLGEEINGEVTSPILTDKIKTWKELRYILDILNRNGGLITNKCGGHVNIGAHILGDNPIYWRNLFLLWILYEKEIYSFSSGEYNKVRKNNDCIERIKYKLNLKELLLISETSKLYSIFKNPFSKNNDIAVNVSNISLIKKENNRIEFRVPNGTLSEEIWQNYINFFSKFVMACKKELDLEKIIYKIKNNDHNAVEFADYIFKNQIDKNYFLIQTLKTNKVYKKQLSEHIKYI